MYNLLILLSTYYQYLILSYYTFLYIFPICCLMSYGYTLPYLPHPVKLINTLISLIILEVSEIFFHTNSLIFLIQISARF